MPKPDEICVVNAGGTLYRSWKEVEVERVYPKPVSECRLVVAEIGDFKQGWKSLRLKPGDPASITLAGQLAVTGAVAVRQVGYDADNHAVRFVIQSKAADIANGTVDVPPGQFKNYNLSQLANAALAKYSVTFSLRGAVDGADKPFPRVSVNIGESPLQFIARLCSMRNVHIVDDANGNIVGTRGQDGVIAELQEGRNILSAEMIWRHDFAVDRIKTTGDTPGNDNTWGDDARANAAQATNPHFNRSRPLEIVAPHPGDKKDMQMLANHEVDLNVATMFSANVTLRGWSRDNGSLWLNSVGELVSVYSPMLFPQETATLGIQGVTQRQGQGGTTTTLSLVLPRALGGRDKLQTDGPSAAEPAQPQEEKT
jgi:prophage tail gpP-like protein